ncbi:unnamed protein product, partial [Prorocentrum cordatum]
RPPDGLLIAVKDEAFSNITFMETQFNGAAFGRVDMLHKATCRSVRVVNCHARGGNAEQDPTRRGTCPLAAFSSGKRKIRVRRNSGSPTFFDERVLDSDGPVSVGCLQRER